MNYNDIQERLNRTLSSLNIRFDKNIIDNTNIHFIETHNSREINVNFGKDDQIGNLNQIMLILHLLSSFKDHLKTKLNEKGINPQIVEDEINGSLHLQLLIDIVNQEKHGSPLTKSRRSLKDPHIINVRQTLMISSSTETNSVSFFSMYPNGNIEHSDNVRISIEADVIDINGNLICSINELIDNCYAQWNSIITKHSLQN